MHYLLQEFVLIYQSSVQLLCLIIYVNPRGKKKDIIIYFHTPHNPNLELLKFSLLLFYYKNNRKLSL